jgi:Big-like domain-containing protein
MNSHHDPELDDVLQDDELRRLASVLRSARMPEPPLDDAFRTGLRRQLMKEAWEISEGRDSWWRRLFAPPGLAWAGAVTGLLLIAAVVVWTAGQAPGGLTQVVASSNLDGKNSVALSQPIYVSFNQPMNHQTTEAAVQITPATNVTFSWDQNTLTVQPSGGNLAPNTQYHVTIGPTATTASGQHLNAPQTITFVTQTPTPPTPAPTPRPSPTPVLGEKQLASVVGATALKAEWSPDSSSIYYVDGKGALGLVSAKGGSIQVIAPDGVTSVAMAPAGDRLAYVRGDKIEVLTFATGKTDEQAPNPAPLLVGWAKDKLMWATADGIYQQTDNGPSQIESLPKNGNASVVSISPDGTHAIQGRDQTQFVVDLATGKSAQLGQGNGIFQAWSPDGTLLVYAAGDNIIVADTLGVTQTTLSASGEASWSSQDAILIGGDTLLYEVHPDGSNGIRVSNGTYHFPLWAPNGTAFAFLRSGSLWVASAPALPPIPPAVDKAGAVVMDFMEARLASDAGRASSRLDDNGKKAYGPDGLALVVNGDPRFSRYYVLTQELTGTEPDTARFVVRLVLTHGKIDVSSYEETLTLIGDPSTRDFLIDQAVGGPHRNLGRGAEVVNVDVAPDGVKVTFDSDLDPGTVADGVIIVDSKGKQVNATATYANKTVTLSGLDLKEGSSYRLVVMTTMRDVLGHNVAAEYDLDFVGPAVKKHGNHRDVGTPLPSPSPAGAP